MAKIPCAIIGSGNIGTDLMIKVMRTSKALEMGAMVGIDPSLRRPRARRPSQRADDPRGHRGPAQAAELQGHQGRVRRDLGRRARQEQRHPAKGRQEGDRPDARRDRPLHHSGDQRRRQHRRAERQHGDLRRPGDHPDGLCGQARDEAGDLGRDRRLDLVEVGRSRHARQHRRVHRDDLERDREARRRRARQGDHHSEPGRAAADHARHGLHAVAGRHAGGDRAVGRRHGRPRCRNTCPAIA